MNNNVFINSYVEKLNREKLIIKQLVSNEDYFKWLEAFVAQNDKEFCDDDWEYCPEKINEDDKRQVEKLYLFYETLSDYAAKNGIPEKPADDFCGSSLLVKFNSKVYDIGRLSGQGTFFYCRQIDDNQNSNVINFCDVITKGNNKDNQM